MKPKFIILLLALQIIPFSAFGQLTFPYFQNFEDQSFINDPSIGLDVNGPEPLPRDEINVTYGYGYSWEVVDNFDKTGKALKLTAHPNDHNKGADFPRSRSEITYTLDNSQDIYISYQILFPDGNEFREVQTNQSYNIVLQFQGSLFSPVYKKNHSLQIQARNGNQTQINSILGIMTIQPPTANQRNTKMRDLEFWTNDPENSRLFALGRISREEYDRRRMRLNIRNGIEIGKWSEIIIKISFSERNGGYQFWINRQPVLLESLGNVQFNEHFTTVRNSNRQPFKLKTGNLLFSTDSRSQRLPMLLKTGLYRNDINISQSIYLAKFRVWNRFPVNFTNELGKTRIIDEQCNKKSNKGDLILYATDDPAASYYTFRFRDMENGDISTFESEGPAIDMRNNRTLKGKKTYEVDVKTTGEFGEKCVVKSQKVK